VVAAFHAPQYCLGIADSSDAAAGTPASTFGHREHTEIVRHLAISPDGGRIVAAGIGLVVRSWTWTSNMTSNWAQEASVQLQEDTHSPVCWLSIVGLAFADHDMVVVVRSDGLVEWWDPTGRTPAPPRRRATSVPVTAALWVPSPPRLCTGHWDGTVGVFVQIPAGPGFVPLVRLDAQAHAVLVPPRSSGAAARLSDAYRCVRALALSDDGTVLFVGGLDSMVRLWSLAAGPGGRFVAELPCPPDAQGVLCLAQRRGCLVAGCTVGVQVWAQDGDGRWQPLRDDKGDTCADHIRAYRSLVTSVKLTDDAKHLVTSGPHHHTRTLVWSTATGRPAGSLFERGQCATALAVMPLLVTHNEALQAVGDISEATGLLPDVSELVFRFLHREHADSPLALDYYRS